MTEPFDIEKEAFNLFCEISLDPSWMTLGPIKISEFGRRCWNEAIERAAEVARLHDTCDTNAERAASYRRAVDEITQNILKFNQEPRS